MTGTRTLGSPCQQLLALGQDRSASSIPRGDYHEALSDFVSHSVIDN
jgi:hypothetical protein